jgi:hypothetical protein
MLSIIQVRPKQATTGAVKFKIQDATSSINLEGLLHTLNEEFAPAWKTKIDADVNVDADVRSEYERLEVHIRMEQAETSTKLRQCIDEWLDTGVGSGGVEDPRNRDLTKAPNASRAIRRYSRSRPVRFEVAPRSVAVRFRGDQHTDLMDFTGWNGPMNTPQSKADRLFATCCLSGLHRRLAKCRRPECGRYFELKHWNRIYKRGTFCAKCNRTRSALESTKRKREQDHADKLARTAEAITEWEQDSKKGRTQGTWKEYVCRRYPDITPKFLTRCVNRGELKPPQRSEDGKG